MRPILLLVAALVGCGHADDSLGQGSFRLEVPSSPLVVESGDHLTLELLAVGAASESVTYSAVDLPAFATLDGPRLTLAPSRTDVGEYAPTIVATDGTQTARASLPLRIVHTNTPAMWNPDDDVGMSDLDGGACRWGVGFGADCTTGTSPTLGVMVCDDEDDDATVQVEVEPTGTPFSGTPTHTHTGPTMPAVRPCGGWGHLKQVIRLEGLARGTDYEFAIRVVDSSGASRTFDANQPGTGSWATPDGWVHRGNWYFRTMP